MTYKVRRPTYRPKGLPSKRKDELIAFVTEHQRVPSGKSEDPKEVLLYHCHRNYHYARSASYDPELCIKIDHILGRVAPPSKV